MSDDVPPAPRRAVDPVAGGDDALFPTLRPDPGA